MQRQSREHTRSIDWAATRGMAMRHANELFDYALHLRAQAANCHPPRLRNGRLRCMLLGSCAALGAVFHPRRAVVLHYSDLADSRFITPTSNVEPAIVKESHAALHLSAHPLA